MHIPTELNSSTLYECLKITVFIQCTFKKYIFSFGHTEVKRASDVYSKQNFITDIMWFAARTSSHFFYSVQIYDKDIHTKLDK